MRLNRILAATLAGVFAAAGAGLAGPAAAADAGLYLSIYADRTTPYVEPVDGRSHAFLCLSAAAQVTPKDVCYGFFPRPEAIDVITLANGDTLTRVGPDWTESQGGFHFVQQPGDADNVVLFDAARGMTWRLMLPRGASRLETAAGRQPWQRVSGMRFAAGAPAFIGGNDGVNQYEETVSLPGPSNVVYQRAITGVQRDAVVSAIADWNAGPRRLRDDDYIDAIARVSARLGLKLPHRKPRESAADYVAELSRLN